LNKECAGAGGLALWLAGWRLRVSVRLALWLAAIGAAGGLGKTWLAGAAIFEAGDGWLRCGHQ
jgi:hypothetical protein